MRKYLLLLTLASALQAGDSFFYSKFGSGGPTGVPIPITPCGGVGFQTTGRFFGLDFSLTGGSILIENWMAGKAQVLLLPTRRKGFALGVGGGYSRQEGVSGARATTAEFTARWRRPRTGTFFQVEVSQPVDVKRVRGSYRNADAPGVCITWGRPLGRR